MELTYLDDSRMVQVAKSLPCKPQAKAAVLLPPSLLAQTSLQAAVLPPTFSIAGIYNYEFCLFSFLNPYFSTLTLHYNSCLTTVELKNLSNTAFTCSEPLNSNTHIKMVDVFIWVCGSSIYLLHRVALHCQKDLSLCFEI